MNNRSRRYFFSFALMLRCLLSFSLHGATTSAARQPNIIFIYADSFMLMIQAGAIRAVWRKGDQDAQS
ncbi:MAG TPA: hypothetical protein VNQ79_10155 [Blastocatellia bacterium]|nr:hypothetical protein [Blastocatellia bacterium]